jgi:hypothetical protein
LLSLVAFLGGLLAADAGAGPAGPTAPPLIQPPPATGRALEMQRIELKDATDGSGDLLYENSNFTARIAPDGTVSFRDKRVSNWSPFAYYPMDARMGVPSLQSSLKMLFKGRGPPRAAPLEVDEGRAPPETKQLIPEVSRYRPDPREGCRNCSTMFFEMAVPIQGFGRFDLTDELTRFSGKDPNRYQKAVFLAATHERRIHMAVKMHAANIRRASEEMPGRLLAIACDPRLTVRERRAILVALGKEMDTATPEGRSAASAITAFVDKLESGAVTCPTARK